MKWLLEKGIKAYMYVHTVVECGLFICVEFLFVGASPDGLVTCTCCSDGICEIKVSLVLSSYTAYVL